MALSIKSPEADPLARTLAEVTGLTLSDAIVKASGLGEDLRVISDRCGALPDLDLRSAEEIIGFDEHGVPN